MEVTVKKGKGKGKERERGDEDEEDGDWRRKKTYRYLIRDIPGRHRMQVKDKDGEKAHMKELQDFVLEPEKQIMTITPFERMDRDPWHVSDEPIKQWSLNLIQAESSQAREERKRKKEKATRVVDESTQKQLDSVLGSIF